MSSSLAVGIFVGIMQGYMFVPTVMLARLLSKWAMRPWKKLNCPISIFFSLIMAIIFILMLNFIILLAFRSVVNIHSEYGRGWALGVFIGIIIAGVTPSIENRLRR